MPAPLPRTALTIALVLAGLAGRAAADSRGDFLAALAAGKDTSSYLKRCDVLVRPDGAVSAPCKLTLADLIGPQPGPVTLTTGKPRPRHLVKSDYTLVESDVTARAGGKVVATLRLLEIVSDSGPPTPAVMHWSRPIKDKDLLARAATLPAVAPIVDKTEVPADLESWDYNDRMDHGSLIDDVKNHVMGGDETLGPAHLASWVADTAMVLGSAPGERLVGKKGAATLRKWKLNLAPLDGWHIGGMDRLGWAVGRVQATTTGKKPVKLTYTVLVVITQEMVPSGGAMTTRPALAAFSVAQ